MGSTEDSKSNVWRNYLLNKNANIFDIIKMSIMLAAYDHPHEFRARRDKILETLYSCELINCSGCDKCSKPNMINESPGNDETKMIDEVLRIKEILEKSGHESGSEPRMCVSLKKLQRMMLSVKTLEATGIGKTVKALQKHASKDVSQIARTLVKKWKTLVDEWLSKQSNAAKPTSDEQKSELTDSEGAGCIEDKNELKKKKLHQGKSVKNMEKKRELTDSDGGSCTTEEKYEATKRKLHEGYSENIKKKRKAGCGTGNTIFPLAKKFPQLFVHACDFSHHAITHVKVFTPSVVSPEKTPIVLQNTGRIFKPNSYILLRDYAIEDYAQVFLQCSFYFSEDLLSELFVTAGFTVVDVNTYNREIKNRAKNITMQRYSSTHEIDNFYRSTNSESNGIYNPDYILTTRNGGIIFTKPVHS
ncbi:methyltransferase-like protein 6 [Artemisia annua]|uniref:Methyltransferase-like protein 6 n=1 Tax=Artemisia annua TaxID=35608 RepID=A0A2U1M1D7_ARTAN|nr:methyltransferase-like protein 6 [Artemisia annua]